MVVWVALVSTSHYDFHALGASKNEARDALLAGWQRHCEATGADPDYIRPDEINYLSGPLGTCFRDYSAI
jgi:hypothetical protein